MDYLKKEHINFIEPHMWPPNSPDLNPVDYAIWGAFQQRVYHQRQFKTVEELKRAIVTEWQKLPQHFIDHRLNGSSSPVLMATSLSYGKAKNSTPHRIRTPDPIEIKFGTVDYVSERTRHAKFYANPSKGGFPANG